MDNLYSLKSAYRDLEKSAEDFNHFFFFCDYSWKDNVSDSFKNYAKSAAYSIDSLKTIVDNLSSIDEVDQTVDAKDIKAVVSKIESRCN